MKRWAIFGALVGGYTASLLVAGRSGVLPEAMWSLFFAMPPGMVRYHTFYLSALAVLWIAGTALAAVAIFRRAPRPEPDLASGTRRIIRTQVRRRGFAGHLFLFALIGWVLFVAYDVLQIYVKANDLQKGSSGLGSLVVSTMSQQAMLRELMVGGAIAVVLGLLAYMTRGKLEVTETVIEPGAATPASDPHAPPTPPRSSYP